MSTPCTPRSKGNAIKIEAGGETILALKNCQVPEFPLLGNKLKVGGGKDKAPRASGGRLFGKDAGRRKDVASTITVLCEA
eukprot:2495481-Lingulodinium_polyedra.AAC.1